MLEGTSVTGDGNKWLILIYLLLIWQLFRASPSDRQQISARVRPSSPLLLVVISPCELVSCTKGHSAALICIYKKKNQA